MQVENTNRQDAPARLVENPLQLFTSTQLHDDKDNKSEPLVLWNEHPVIMKNSYTVIAGPPSSLKTYLCTLLGLTLTREKAEDRVLLGFTCPTRCKVLYINADNPHEVIRDRANELGNIPGLPFYVSMGAPELNDKEYTLYLIELIKREGFEVIILDALRCIHDGDENSSRDMRKVAANIRKIINECHVTAVALHHTRKSDRANKAPQDVEDLMGSTQIGAATDSIFMVRKSVEGTYVLSFKRSRVVLESNIPDVRFKLIKGETSSCLEVAAEPEKKSHEQILRESLVNPRCAGELWWYISETYEVSETTMKPAFNKMLKSSIIIATKDGRKIMYSIGPIQAPRAIQITDRDEE